MRSKCCTAVLNPSSVFVGLFWFFEIGFLWIALTALELILWTRLALNSQRSACLCCPSAGIKGVLHHLLDFVVLSQNHVSRDSEKLSI